MTCGRKRNHPVANCMALGHFSEGVMRLCMLLDDDYTPHWKWLAFEFRAFTLTHYFVIYLMVLWRSMVEPCNYANFTLIYPIPEM